MLSAQIRRRFGRWLGTPGEATRARLYVADGCGLCQRARMLLEPLEQRGRIAVEAVDIASEPELFRRYCLEIPVLAIDGGPSLAWPFDLAAVRRALG